MKYKFISLIISFVSGIISIEVFTKTVVYKMMTLILPAWLPYAILTIPIFGFLAGKRVFSLGYFNILMILTLIPITQESELFEGVVDAIYSLGYQDLSRAVMEIFPYQDTISNLFLITFLYIIGIYSENMDRYEEKLRNDGFHFSLYPTLIFLVLILLAIYPNTEMLAVPDLRSDLIVGIISLILFSFSVILIWRMGK